MNNYTLTSQNSQPIAPMKNNHGVVGFRVSASNFQQSSFCATVHEVDGLVHTAKTLPAPRIQASQGTKIFTNEQERYDLQDKIAEICKYRYKKNGEKTTTALHNCRRRTIPHNNAEIWHNGEKSRFGGLEICENAHACPNCAPIIAAQRGEQIAQEMAYLKKKHGLNAYMLTLTTSHKKHELLKDIQTQMKQAFKRLFESRAGRELFAKHGLGNRIVCYEIRYSFVNGWHPHFHVILFSKQHIKQQEFAELEDEIYKLWSHELAKFERTCSRKHGVKFNGGDNAAKYISKWGLSSEITKSHAKKGKLNSFNFFDLLYLADEKDTECEFHKLVVEYVNATKGTKTIQKSISYNELLEDFEYEEEPKAEEKLIMTFNKFEWRLICKLKFRGQVLDITNKCAKFAEPEKYVWAEILRSFDDDELENALVLTSDDYKFFKYKQRLEEDLCYSFGLGSILDCVQREKCSSIREMLEKRLYAPLP